MTGGSSEYRRRMREREGVRSPVLGEQSEDAFQRAVIDLAHLYGWRVAHFRPAQTGRGWTTAVSGDGKGFPDLILVHVQRELVLFRELKAKPGVFSPEQIVWIAELQDAGADADVWKPADWDTKIEPTLRGRRRRSFP